MRHGNNCCSKLLNEEKQCGIMLGESLEYLRHARFLNSHRSRNFQSNRYFKTGERTEKMRKNFGAKTWLYPMPVLIIGTYDENGVPNAMNAAWGGIYDTNQVMICLADDHKTTENIRKNKAFTVSFATAETVEACDYVGIVSANDVPDKLTRSGLKAAKSEFVNAPVIESLKVSVECELEKFNEDGICIGRIVNISADDSVLGDDGLIDVSKLKPIIYESAHHTYLALGAKVGNAFLDGKKIK